MHDPNTLAFEIKYPWHAYSRKHRRETKSEFMRTYRNPFISIWHRDKNGCDGACGWSFVNLTDKQRERLQVIAWDEGRHPYYMSSFAETYDGGRLLAEAKYRGLVLIVCRVLNVKMSFDEAARMAALAIHACEVGTALDQANIFCFKPGFHNNSGRDDAKEREDSFSGRVFSIAREILTDRRPWYRHPRWHFWHWRIQVHPVMKLKRWAFTRCATCGGRFAWGYCPVTHQWESKGPQWFKGERDMHHAECLERKRGNG